MYQDLIRDLKKKSDEVIERLKEEFKNIHTGRASSSLVENIPVSYYGQNSSIKQMASINVPQSNQIVISPWDKNALGDVENAIRASDLGFNPVNDGSSIRIILPPLTEERRNEFVKLVNKMSEEGRVAVRNLRSNVWNEVKKMEKDGKITEDDRYGAEEELNKLVKEYNDKIEELTSGKIKDLTTI